MAEYTRDEIVDAAKKVAASVDGPLTLHDFIRLSKITESHIKRAFPEGRWSEVKHLAGLEYRPSQKTHDEIIETVKKVATQVSGPLSLPQFIRLSGITAYNIIHVFPEDRWRGVKHLAGLERHPKDKVPLSDDALLREFHRVASEVGQIPTWTVFSARANVSEGTLRNRFDGRPGVLECYKRWLEENEPTSPLLWQLRKKLPPSLRSVKTLRAKGSRSQSRSSYVDSQRLGELRAIKSENLILLN